MSKTTFPKTIKVGHTRVMIYHSVSRGSDFYTVTYYLGKGRVRKKFADKDIAITAAETIATKLSEGELRVIELKNDDHFAYVRAQQALAPTGIPLELAAMNYAEAFKILGADLIIEAARFYATKHSSRFIKKTVPDVVKDLLLAKEQDGASDVYLKDLTSRLGAFAEKFTGQMSLLTAGEIETFLRGLTKTVKDGKKETVVSLTGVSRNNYRRAIGTLLYFAESRGFLPKGLVEIDSVAIAKEMEGDIEIFKPLELMRVLERANEKTRDLVPFLAIGAFAGLRHAEMQRLNWSDIRLDDGFIEVKKGTAKTASRRLVPITENLKLWLEDHKRPNGDLCPFANMSKQLMWLAEDVHAVWQAETPKGEFAWKHNALRHSFISYRVASVQNVAQVALEAGNSPKMVFSNYRELVRPADATAWFGITPASVEAAKALRTGKAENIVAMPASVAA